LKITQSSSETALWCERYRAAGLSIGFVPTMGALHEGHLSLMRRARSECDRVVVSIFVNPTQFGPKEDFSRYPSRPETDREGCRSAGVDLLYLGRTSDMYPGGFQTWVEVERLSQPLCGKSRPGHFRGVATVVAQLFQVVKPHRAYFGEKDYHQCRVVQRLVEDLHMETEIRPCETVREADGLAMSSRNSYLDPEARMVAPRIHKALRAARDLALAGESRATVVADALIRELSAQEGLKIEYAEVLDAETLDGFPEGLIRPGPGGVLLAVAARAGGTRLIDNLLIAAEEVPPGPPPRSG
jgi:pantoate--beta-alanine ligase